jgi:hypothetical protein
MGQYLEGGSGKICKSQRMKGMPWRQAGQRKRDRKQKDSFEFWTSDTSQVANRNCFCDSYDRTISFCAGRSAFVPVRSAFVGTRSAFVRASGFFEAEFAPIERLEIFMDFHEHPLEAPSRLNFSVL